MQQSYYKVINLFTVRPIPRVSTWFLRFWCAALLIACNIVQAQVDEITVDPSFDPGLGTNGEVNTLAVQTDGKVIIGGNFTTFDGVSRSGIARLMPNATLDTSFDPGAGADNTFNLAIQADGKVIIGGRFTTFNGIPRNYIARLMPNGTLDTSFDPGAGADNVVSSLAIQADGKVIIAGLFTTFNGVSRNGIARLLPNGALDTSFDPGLGANNYVRSLTVQADGKVIIGGNFTTFDGIPRNGVARLMPNGALDTSFDPGLGINGLVSSLTVQADGKVIIGGRFTTFNGIPRNNIARLMPNGTLDTSFDPGQGADNWVRALAIQADGKVIIGGWFTSFDGVPRNHIARLIPDGTLDISFDTELGADDWVRSLTVQANGNILIGGDFTTFNGVTRSRIARLIVPFAAGPQVPVPALNIVVLMALASMLCLFGRRHRSMRASPPTPQRQCL